MMATDFQLHATKRTPGHANRERAQGLVPAVLYGKGLTPEALQCDAHNFGLLLAQGGAHHLLTLEVEGESQPRTVVLKEIQHHPVTRRVLHVDFQAVSASDRIHAEVPVHLVGEDQVAKSGGLLQVSLHTLRITCLPADLPEFVAADVVTLRPGDVLTVGDLVVDPRITVLNGAEEIVAGVHQPRTAQAEAPAGEAPAAPAGE